MGIKVFLSYTHVDEKLRNELEIHLASLKRRDIISVWCDRRITAGMDIDSEIDENLDDSEVILLLISPHFIASNYCYEIEMDRALKRHEEGDARVIPVILEPCNWHDMPFGKLKATPTDGKPVSMWPNINEALSIVTKDIQDAAADFVGDHQKAEEEMVALREPVTSKIRSSNLRLKREFSDLEKDDFVSESFRVISALFTNSLKELEDRNNTCETRFSPIDKDSFQATIYQEGRMASECKIWIEGGSGNRKIRYSSSPSMNMNSYNEELGPYDDGYELFLRPMGMFMGGRETNTNMSSIGGAEYIWAMLIDQLQ